MDADKIDKFSQNLFSINWSDEYANVNTSYKVLLFLIVGL